MEANGIIYKLLSYQLMSILFSVHNQLGPSFQEKYYQRAVEELLKENSIPYKKELLATLSMRTHRIGHYFLDFLIDGKIVLELKAKPTIEADDIRQVFTYLKTTGIKLGILVNFRTKKLTYKRIVNPKVPTPME